MAEPQTARVLIPHPTEELIFAKLQKELISDFFEEGRILYAVKPLWIKINTPRWLSSPEGVSKPQSGSKPVVSIRCFASLNHQVDLGNLESTETEIFITVTINKETSGKLSLVKIHSGKEFTDSERQSLSQKKQPVRQLKVFRLGVEKELSSNSKCITESKWIKIR